MKTIGERIKIRREQLQMSQEELAKKLGYKSRSSINKIEMESRNLTQSKIKAIADALETTPSYIMGWENTDDIIPDIPGILPIKTKRFPLLGEIACGEPRFASEDFDAYVEGGTDVKADFCLKAKGDSMTGARIHDGDIVFIRKQDTVNNGEIAAVIIEDDATLKRVYYYRDKNLLVLRAENPDFDDMVYSDEQLDQVRILGKAVAFQSDVK